MRNLSNSPPLKKDPLLDEPKGGTDELINYLEQKLEDIEKKLFNT